MVCLKNSTNKRCLLPPPTNPVEPRERSCRTASHKLRTRIACILVVVVSSSLLASARTFTVTNNCPFTIWPAVFTDLNVGSVTPDTATGWEAAPSSSVNFTVPDNWKAGRIWARRDCDFTTNPGPNSCLDGGCNGGLLCDPHTGTGIPPSSVAEWTLSGDGNLDFYDTSLVDGYNLPLRITNDVGCPVADCPVDLGPNCPDPLKGPFDTTGFPVGCRSACQADLDGNPTNSANCCSGSHSTAATCPPTGVEFYSYFKNSCPNSYVYAFDESSGTALWTCDSSKNADYTLTFCPPSGNVTNPVNSGVAGTSLPADAPVGTPSAAPTSATTITASTGVSSAGAVGNTNMARRPDNTKLVWMCGVLLATLRPLRLA